MQKNKSLMTYFINLCFFLYFLILIVERTISVVLSFVNNVDVFGNAFNGYIYLLVFLSIIGFIVYLVTKCRPHVKALFKPVEELNFVSLCIASGILLHSGMVHTEYTIPVVQFISYGVLIIGILLQVIVNHKTSNNKPLLWISFVYLVCFSMAIPVMYHSLIELHVLFHILEAITSITLVITFTYLFIFIFKGESDLFKLWPIITAVVLDAILIALRWPEEINFFVLIFISLAALTFLLGHILKLAKKKK